MKWRTVVVGMAILGVVCAVHKLTGAQGQPGPGPGFVHWDEAKLSQPAHKVKIDLNVRVPMRDGVKLSADIYRPDAEGKFPALLLRTPYSNNAQDEIADSKWYAERGYVVVNQDVRGRYDSGGEFYAYKNEANDGYDTDEWIGKQPWSNGKIGTIGGSYLGYTQVTQAVRNSKYLTAIAAELTSTDIHQGWVFVDGAFHLGFALPWGAGTIDGHTTMTGPPAVYDHLPLATADQALGHMTPHYRDWLKHPDRNDPYWNDISFEKEARKISVPYFAVAGWYDIFLRGQLWDDVEIRKGSPTKAGREGKRLLIGPWVHMKNSGSRYNGQQLPATGFDRRIDFGPEAELNRRNLYLRWNDYWLKGIDNGVATEAPVKIFVMGENRWRNEQEWPLARTQYTKYYIQSGGRANSATGNGTLGTATPIGAATDAFTYDPLAPVPSLGGNVCCSSVPNGARDHSRLEMREDVLVYTAPVLTEGVEVTGPIAMKLFAATTAKDTDWVARLIDVHPDGYAQNMQDGIVRARYRAGKGKPASLLDPGKVYEYDLDLWATSNVFLPGHRIRLEITSSNFPRFDRNLNTGEDPATATRMEKAQQTIYHSAQYPSYIVLPIIPRTGTPAQAR
jgi:putative CocE/NonD family hydrolase